jgi:hypothetical protein
MNHRFELRHEDENTFFDHPTASGESTSPEIGRRRDVDALVLVGWQEWAALPELGVSQLTVKLDTGAVSSSIHAENIRYFRRNQTDWVRFDLGDRLGVVKEDCRCESRLLGFRSIRSSSGHQSRRPVIETTMVLAGFYWTIELTLARRRTMMFPLLIGRDALAGRCMVDCGRTFLANHRYLASPRLSKRSHDTKA